MNFYSEKESYTWRQIHYQTLTDASLGYYNLKLEEKSLYLTSFSCQFGGYGYVRLPFKATAMRDMLEAGLLQVRHRKNC